MSAPEHIPTVCFIDDLARVLRTSRRTLERLRAASQLPIPEIKGIDSRPRWSGEAVRRFIERGDPVPRSWRKAS